jgi:hypothetical protein
MSSAKKKIDQRFENLRRDLETNYEGFNNLADENSALFIYDPTNEKNMIENVHWLSRKLNEQYELTKISMFDLLFDGLEELTSGGLDSVYERESKDSGEFSDDARGPLRDYISEKIIEKDEEMNEGITLIYRCGALYPLLRVHTITAKLEGKLENPTMIFYPGEKEGQELLFLNTTSQTGDYRAKIYEG